MFYKRHTFVQLQEKMTKEQRSLDCEEEGDFLGLGVNAERRIRQTRTGRQTFPEVCSLHNSAGPEYFGVPAPQVRPWRVIPLASSCCVIE